MMQTALHSPLRGKTGLEGLGILKKAKHGQLETAKSDHPNIAILEKGAECMAQLHTISPNPKIIMNIFAS